MRYGTPNMDDAKKGATKKIAYLPLPLEQKRQKKYTMKGETKNSL